MPIKEKLHQLLNPEKYEGQSELRYWQERVLRGLLFLCVLLGGITFVPSVGLALKEGLLPVVAIDIVMYVYVLGIFFFPRLSFALRAVSFLVIIYFLGLVLLLVIGPHGGGPVWLFAFPVLSVILLGGRTAAAALIVNGVTIALVGLSLLSGLIQWQSDVPNPIAKWIVVGLNFLLLDTLVVLSVSTILRGLRVSLIHAEKSKQKYLRIFNNIQDVYYEEELDGTIREVSPSIEMVTHFTLEDLIGQPFQKIYESPEDRDALRRQIETGGSLNNYELPIKDKDGTLRICSVNARLIDDEDAGVPLIVGIFRDISARKEMEEKNRALQLQLERAQKMEALGLLAGGVAHDLNNMLSAVVGFPELILMGMAPEDPHYPLIAAVKSSGEKAAEVIQDLLTLSRRGVMTRETVSLNEVVEGFIVSPECSRILSHHPESQLRTELHADAPLVLGSPVHISKAVMNLVSNAAEAQEGRGGGITISTENVTVTDAVLGYSRVVPGEYVVLSVKDEGSGIEPDVLERIFEPFFTKKKMGRSGSGLGMAVVWGTVRDHDAFIDIKSVPGKGTTFILYFPKTDKQAAAPKDISSYESCYGDGEHILVVDDEAAQREVARRMLGALKYRVTTLESGEKAVDYLRTRTADLVLLDMIIEPGMDGLETYRQILQVCPGQKAVIASGFSETGRVKEMIRLGAGAYVKKPYTLKEVGFAVQDTLKQR